MSWELNSLTLKLCASEPPAVLILLFIRVHECPPPHHFLLVLLLLSAISMTIAVFRPSGVGQKAVTHSVVSGAVGAESLAFLDHNVSGEDPGWVVA